MADGTYRFQQPGAGQFYFQAQAQQNPHQRHIVRNGTNSPTGRLKFNTDTPSPSRSPALNQAAALSSFNNMYGQTHQGQHVMMNGGQAHQRFGMPIPKFQSQTHHSHHTQQPHHHAHHAQATHNLTHQHNFPGGALATTTTSHFNSTHLQNGVPTAEDDLDESMNEHWQQQLQLAAESRQATSPHYHARVIAQQTKGIQLMSSNTDTENGTDGRNGASAGKPASRQGWNALDFGGQGLRALTTSLFNYGFIEKLYLNSNKLKVLPPAIGQLRKLNHLDLSGNELTELPEELGMLSNLKKLLLFDNNIRTLPYEMGYLYRLETLGIEGNPLNDVLKSQIMKDGTKALIRYLKEEMPGVFQQLTPLSSIFARHFSLTSSLQFTYLLLTVTG
jgi:CCR4-NOT transcription complex subunit 6